MLALTLDSLRCYAYFHFRWWDLVEVGRPHYYVLWLASGLVVLGRSYTMWEVLRSFKNQIQVQMNHRTWIQKVENCWEVPSKEEIMVYSSSHKDHIWFWEHFVNSCSILHGLKMLITHKIMMLKIQVAILMLLKIVSCRMLNKRSKSVWIVLGKNYIHVKVLMATFSWNMHVHLS